MYIVNSNHLKGILTTRMPIWTIPTEFEQFECKVEQLQRDSNRSKANSNHLKGILTIRMQILTIRKEF